MRGFKAITLGLAISIMFSMTAFASSEGWVKNEVGWWYQRADNSYPTNTWEWLDGNKDGVAECYYFGIDGYLAVNTTIDGYTVNNDGAWTIDGVVQTKAVVVYGEQTEEGTEAPKNKEVMNGVLDEETLNNIPVRGIGSGNGVHWF